MPRQYGYVLRKDENDLVRHTDFEVESIQPRDRPKITWMKVTDKDFKSACKQGSFHRKLTDGNQAI